MRVFALLILAACGAAASTPADPTVAAATRTDVDVGALHEALAAGTVDVLVDVRTPGEHAAGHVPGAVNIPLDELPGRLDELRGHDDVTVICEVGGRSAAAAGVLTGAGIDAVNVTGGTSAWRAAGYPVE